MYSVLIAEWRVLLVFQVTTHSHLLSSDEVEGLGKDLPLAPRAVHSFLLQEFDTELDFSSKVRYCHIGHVHCRVVNLFFPSFQKYYRRI